MTESFKDQNVLLSPYQNKELSPIRLDDADIAEGGISPNHNQKLSPKFSPIKFLPKDERIAKNNNNYSKVVLKREKSMQNKAQKRYGNINKLDLEK